MDEYILYGNCNENPCKSVNITNIHCLLSNTAQATAQTSFGGLQGHQLFNTPYGIYVKLYYYYSQSSSAIGEKYACMVPTNYYKTNFTADRGSYDTNKGVPIVTYSGNIIDEWWMGNTLYSSAYYVSYRDAQTTRYKQSHLQMTSASAWSTVTWNFLINGSWVNAPHFNGSWVWCVNNTYYAFVQFTQSSQTKTWVVRYDNSLGYWVGVNEYTGTLANPRTGHKVWVVDNKAYYAPGPSGEYYIWNEATGLWDSIDMYKKERDGQVAGFGASGSYTIFVLSGKAYYAKDVLDGMDNGFYRFNPKTNTWEYWGKWTISSSDLEQITWASQVSSRKAMSCTWIYDNHLYYCCEYRLSGEYWAPRNDSIEFMLL